jgi:hypothetical protein
MPNVMMKEESIYAMNLGPKWYEMFNLLLKSTAIIKSYSYITVRMQYRQGTKTYTTRATEYFESLVKKATGNLDGDEFIRVSWLSITLFFVVGGYWLLRSLKDPIMSVINGVSSPSSLKSHENYSVITH